MRPQSPVFDRNNWPAVYLVYPASAPYIQTFAQQLPSRIIASQRHSQRHTSGRGCNFQCGRKLLGNFLHVLRGKEIVIEHGSSPLAPNTPLRFLVFYQNHEDVIKRGHPNMRYMKAAECIDVVLRNRNFASRSQHGRNETVKHSGRWQHKQARLYPIATLCGKLLQPTMAATKVRVVIPISTRSAMKHKLKPAQKPTTYCVGQFRRNSKHLSVASNYHRACSSMRARAYGVRFLVPSPTSSIPLKCAVPFGSTEKR